MQTEANNAEYKILGGAAENSGLSVDLS